jgi:dTDP-4-amino-4,6-dideoxygalactose transaminase
MSAAPVAPAPEPAAAARDLRLFRPQFRVDECLAEIRDCLEKGWTGIGYKTVEFEARWREYTGLPHAHFVNSASAGLHLAMHILKSARGWQDGDEVISTPLTFVSTNHAILHERLRCVFADVDDSLNLSPASVAARIGPRTRALVFVGMGGSVDNLTECLALARRHGLAFILDAAHMTGSRADGVHVGAGADAAVFSFQAVKNCPSADSGMVCMAEPALAERARRLAWLGIDKDTYARTGKGGYDWKYDVSEVGHNYHGNSVVAAIALVSLRYVDADNDRRRALAAHYERRLADVPGVTAVRHRRGQSSRHLFQVLVEERDRILGDLRAHGIHAGVHYQLNSDYSYRGVPADCPRARYLAERLLSLPCHLALTPDDLDQVVDVLARLTR